MLIGKQNNGQSAFAHLTSTVPGGNKYQNLGNNIFGYLLAITTTPSNSSVSNAYNQIVQECETMQFSSDDSDAIAKAACLAFCVAVMGGGTGSGITPATPGQAQCIGAAAATAAATEILSLCGCDSGCSPDSIAIAAGLGAGLAFFASPTAQTKVAQYSWGQLMAIGLLQ